LSRVLAETDGYARETIGV